MNIAMPCNIEAEQQILGSILTDNTKLDGVSDILTEDHFYEPVHRRIWAATSARIRGGAFVSPVTLKHIMEADEGLRELGGPSYLARLAAAAAGFGKVRDYAIAVIDAWQRRKVLEATGKAQELIVHGGDLEEARGVIESAASVLTLNDRKPPSTSFIKALARSVRDSYDAYQGNGGGLLTGITDYDQLTGGMHPADMIVLAGGPSMGKTSLALAIVEAVASRGVGTVVVSLEMSEESLAQRLVSKRTGIPYFRLRSGDFTENEGRKILEQASALESLPIEIIASHVREIGAIHAVTKRIQDRMKRTVPKGLGLVVIDYLQLVRAPVKDRFQMVAEVSQSIKSMAKQLGLPVIALSQISRDVANRDDKRPRLNDLRESAQIEQDSDIVMFCHRDHYYLEREGAPRGRDGKPSIEALVDYEAALKAAEQQMDLIMAKHRSGAIGSRKLGCDIKTNRLWSLSDASDANQSDMAF